jgi:polysaccharide export outer membrane protein
MTSEMRLSALLDGKRPDLRAIPGDRLSLVSAPLSFSVLGAAGRTEQFLYDHKVMLAQAVAMAGGANAQMGDPAAIFVFRYIVDERGERRPMVYHINMMKTGAYFLAQNFEMQDGDVLYIGNARANQASKLIQLVSQLFSPLMTVTSAVSIVQNSNR